MRSDLTKGRGALVEVVSVSGSVQQHEEGEEWVKTVLGTKVI